MSGPAFQSPRGLRDSTERALSVGEVVASNYVIRDEVTRTDTGVVFEARDMMLDRLVALKLVWRDPNSASLILEARRCAAVRDPCAVSIHGMGSHHGVEFVVCERVTGTLLRELLQASLPSEVYLSKLRTLIAAVGRAHECGIAIGDISGSTVLVDKDGRVVLGRLSMSQVPAFGPLGRVLAPELIRSAVEPGDPSAAEAIDLYGLGCVAIEMAKGVSPFADDDATLVLRGHAYEPPPRLTDLRPDLPTELSDLVEWLLTKDPAGRPPSAREVLAQLDAVTERLGSKGHTLRVLIIDDDTARARWLWSLARRAQASAVVEIASDGADAAHKLNRDHPDLVFVDASLRGVMNALELCMYARGLESEHLSRIVVIGSASEGDRALFTSMNVPFIPDDADLPIAIVDRIRLVAVEERRRRKPRSTISG